MKDRLFNSLDANTVQHYRLRKPECPFKQTQQMYARVKPAVAANTSQLGQHQQHNKNVGGYHQAITDSAIGKQQQSNYYNANQYNPQQQLQSATYVDHTKSANTLNTPFMPVAATNHPLPPSNIYSAAAANANPMPFRSTTPAIQPKAAVMQQPPVVPQQQAVQQPTSFFAPSAASVTNPTNGLINQPAQSESFLSEFLSIERISI
jgi:hypothetical protein